MRLKKIVTSTFVFSLLFRQILFFCEIEKSLPYAPLHVSTNFNASEPWYMTSKYSAASLGTLF